MNKIIIFITITIFIIIIFSLTPRGWQAGLVGPNLKQDIKSPEPTSAPPVTPKTINYDRSTDLKAELEKVNPQVLDSDFE